MAAGLTTLLLGLAAGGFLGIRWARSDMWSPAALRGRVSTPAGAAFVRSYQFPAGLFEKALEHRGPVASVGYADVEQGLREFLYAVAVSPDMGVAMPSVIVDDAWHCFITFTRQYAAFCQSAYGRFLHHIPETEMEPQARRANGTIGMLRAWDGARKADIVASGRPGFVPTLFRIDAAAGLTQREYIESCGHAHVAICRAPSSTVCVLHQLRPEGMKEQGPDGNRRGRSRGQAGCGAAFSSCGGGGSSCSGGSSCGGSGCGGGGCGGS